tara:strand:+ start:5490 stop:6191 length:702 start_codon:yes stop_codon:yes gene_type:complete
MKDFFANRHIPRGKHIGYIKTGKEQNRAEVLIEKALGTKAKLIDLYVETKGRKDYHPELLNAVKACNAKGATLIVPNLGHLSRNLNATHTMNKLEGRNSKVTAVREIDGKIACFRYGTMQMEHHALDRYVETGVKIKKGLLKKKRTGWQAGNRKNLDFATIKASAKRRELADEYVRSIIPRIRLIQSRIHEKATLQQIADSLMAQKVLTRTGKETWTPIGVSNILKKAKKLGI